MKDDRLSPSRTMDELRDSWAGFDDWSARRRRINRIRWGTVIIYMVLVFGVSSLPYLIEIEEMLFATLDLAVVFGGMIAVFAALLYPYLKKEREPVVPDGILVERVSPPSAGPFHETVKMTALPLAMVPLIIVYLAIMVMIPEPLLILIMAIVIVFLLVLMLLFYTLEVYCDGTTLSFHFGPIGKDVPVEEIESIRATVVHSLKDFMGYGIRMGPDGSVGYIATGNVGVKVSLKNGKQYVITLKDPQALVDCVRRGGRGT